MPDEKSSHKLTSDQQVQVCQWLAEMKKPSEVVQLVKKEWDIDITRETITITYLKGEKWQGLIKELHDEWVKNIQHIPIANKAKRLEVLQKIINEAQEEHLTAVGRSGIKIYKKDYASAVRALALAHKEIEGNVLDVKGNITHNHLLSDAIKRAKGDK